MMKRVNLSRSLSKLVLQSPNRRRLEAPDRYPTRWEPGGDAHDSPRGARTCSRPRRRLARTGSVGRTAGQRRTKLQRRLPQEAPLFTRGSSHAIGSVLSEQLFAAPREDGGADLNAQYVEKLNRLTAES